MIYQILGLLFFLIGSIHAYQAFEEPELHLVMFIQNYLSKKPWISLFRELWFFGRTTFTIVGLTLLTAYDWKMGSIAFLVFGVIVGLEQLVKNFFGRERPFITSREISMLQPTQPTDPSYPSGDTLRVWFLALIMGVAVGNNPILLLVLILVAVLVSLGRVAMGVHYLTDILAGAGLGILGAGTVIWLWSNFSLL